MSRTLLPGAPPARVALRPGVHVVRRDRDHLQVGLDAPARVIVRADRDVAVLLDALAEGLAPVEIDDAGRRLLHDLDAAGLLAESGPHPGPLAVSGPVELVSHGLDLTPLRALLTASGVSVASGPPSADAALRVVASPGPLPRAALDRWVRDGASHLVLAGTGHPGSLRLGPLVEPGRSACLRCVDAHEAMLDPRRPLLVEQLVDRPPAPLPTSLTALALAWTAREVGAFLAGEQPSTWSATLELHTAVPDLRRWERHPHCGCAWHEIGYR